MELGSLEFRSTLPYQKRLNPMTCVSSGLHYNLQPVPYNIPCIATYSLYRTHSLLQGEPFLKKSRVNAACLNLHDSTP